MTIKIHLLIAIPAVLLSFSSSAQDLEKLGDMQRKQFDDNQKLCNSIFEAAQLDTLIQDPESEIRRIYVEVSSKPLVWAVSKYPRGLGSHPPGHCKYEKVGAMHVEQTRVRGRLSSSQFKFKGSLLIRFHQEDADQPVRRYVAGWRRGTKCGERIEWLLQEEGWYDTFVALERLANKERIFGTVDCYDY